MNKPDRQSGSILVPILVIAIIIVAVLLWMALTSDGTNSASSGSGENSAAQLNTQTDSGGDNPAAGDSQNPNGEAATPSPRGPTAGEIAAKRVEEYRAATGRIEAPDPNAQLSLQPASSDTRGALESQRAALQGSTSQVSPEQTLQNIERAAAKLITRHSPDFSACRGLGDSEASLECAANVHSDALKAAFDEHNALLASGDAVSEQRGSEIVQRVIDEMQQALTSFTDTAN